MFGAKTAFGAVQWQEGEGFTGDPLIVALIRVQIEGGEPVQTVASGPFVASADTPELNAWYTARSVLERFFGDSVEWVEPASLPTDLLTAPEGSLA